MNATRKFQNTQGKTPPTPQHNDTVESDLLLHTTGFHDNEVVAFQNVDTGKYVYMTYSQVKGNLPGCADVLKAPGNHGFSVLAQPLKPGLTPCTWGNPSGLTYREGDISRILWVHITISRKGASRVGLTKSQGTAVRKIHEQVIGYTKEQGFGAVVGRWSGCADHLSIPVEITNPHEIAHILESLQADIRREIPCTDYLIETHWEPRDMGIIGINQRFHKRPVERIFSSTPPTTDSIVAARESNTRRIMELDGAGIESLPQIKPTLGDLDDSPKDDGTLANFELPPLIAQIAENISKNNPVHCPSTDKAIAIPIFSMEVGRSRKDDTDTYFGINTVVLARSASGKNAGASFTKRLYCEVGNRLEDNSYPAMVLRGTGSTFGTMEGISDTVLRYGRVMIQGDESEGFVLPSNDADRTSQNAREIRSALQSAHNNDPAFERALAGKSRPATQTPYVVECHTTQAERFFPRITSEHSEKGVIGRLVILKGFDSGLLKGEKHSKSNIDEALIKNSLYWASENLKGFDEDTHKFSFNKESGDEVAYGGRFTPTPKVVQWSDSLYGQCIDYANLWRKKADEHHKNGEGFLYQSCARRGELLKKIAGLFTLGYDREATEITQQAYDCAIKFIDLMSFTLTRGVHEFCRTARDKAEDAILKAIWELGNGNLVSVRELQRRLPKGLKLDSLGLSNHLNILGPHGLGYVEFSQQGKSRMVRPLERPSTH